MSAVQRVATNRDVKQDAAIYNATLVRRDEATSSLARFWVRLDEKPISFEPGQYMTIGVVVYGRLVQRPYSVASSAAVAGEAGYELYVRLVTGGEFTPILWALPVGHRLRMIGPKGKFTLGPDDTRTHVFVSTGTGNAPFVSMILRSMEVGAPRPVLFLNGVSYIAELGYRDLIEGWQQSGAYPVVYEPTISRPGEESNAPWAGRVGRAEAVLGEVLDAHCLTPANAIAYLCGNPDMIRSAQTILADRGFPQELVRTEQYWPNGSRSPAEPGQDREAARWSQR